MNALVLHAVGDLRYEQVPTPQPGAGEVLVRVAYCGVCGSDIPRIFVKGTYRFPLICGHEFAGVVERCGEGVQRVSPGDRVTVFPLLWCGRCSACERGRYAQCEHYDYLGSRRDGAFAEYVVAPERNLLKVPDGVSLQEAAMTEPAAVAYHALRRAGGVAPGETVAIFGAGPIGLMVAQWARVMGASQIALFDVVDEKIALAQRLGFTHAYHSHRAEEIIASLTQGKGAHVCVEAAGVPQTLLQACACARSGGRVVLLGNPAGDATVPTGLWSQLMRREVNLFGTWNSEYAVYSEDDDWHTALRAMAEGWLQLMPLVSHQVPLSEAVHTLHAMREGKGFFCKVLIQP
ncbi:MAG: galactitol-1-phosphate 5-dehydrogenase [Chthonomonadetes bacterium]|nr:galactitol-1-phosphate 5-dehydrogenase [Chthonomonadetes bacterium]